MSEETEETETQSRPDPESLALALLRACGYTEQQADAEADILLDFIYRRQRDQLLRNSQPTMLGRIGVGPCQQIRRKGDERRKDSMYNKKTQNDLDPLETRRDFQPDIDPAITSGDALPALAEVSLDSGKHCLVQPDSEPDKAKREVSHAARIDNIPA